MLVIDEMSKSRNQEELKGDVTYFSLKGEDLFLLLLYFHSKNSSGSAHHPF